MTKAPHIATTAELTGGSYEIIRQRLTSQAATLRQRVQALNTARQEVFGSTERTLLANDRLHTDNYCLARDLVAIGDLGLLGYNVQIGLRSGITLSDVFSVYRLTQQQLEAHDLSPLQDERFETDFQNLYRYYKEAYFARFDRRGQYLYMVFHLTPQGSDFKAFKWLVTDDTLRYIDNRSDHEVHLPPQHEFRWTRSGRDEQRSGRHPHISILDRVFVETVGGDLTIKVEDNTDDGHGIYREPVEYPDQTLDDAEFSYADLGHLIALRVRPYQEADRYFIFNDRLQSIQRSDALGRSGVLLPDNQGLIFANGYYLQTGEYKLFDYPADTMRFYQRIVSPNGEDYLFVFTDEQQGTYVLLHYNIIDQSVATPILCNGYTVFPDGELCYFRTEAEPTKHHVVQIWQTPFRAGELPVTAQSDSYLYKIGNKDIVRAMAEISELLTLTGKEDSYLNLYTELTKRATDLLDSYYWLDHAAVGALHEPLQQIRETARTAVEEYERKRHTQQQTTNALREAQQRAEQLFDTIRRSSHDTVDAFVQQLAQLRTLRGELIGLRDLPYADTELLNTLDEQTATASEQLAERCIEFLLRDDALDPYRQRIEETATASETSQTASALREQLAAFTSIGTELELLIEIVGNLPIEDATQSTRIIEQISGLFTQLNQQKAALRNRQQQLHGAEAAAAFGVQMKLLDQSLLNYLDLADTPDKCDQYLSRLMVQLEEMEGKFAEVEDFIRQLGEKREEVYAALEQRKNSLIEARNNRTAALAEAANRILEGIGRRSQHFADAAEVNGFFAADLLVSKLRDIMEQLRQLDDTNKAESIQTRLKTLQEETLQQLRDRQDLFVDGENVIRFGQHNFAVNVQPLTLTLVQRQDQLWYHLTGTDFYEAVSTTALTVPRHIWTQPLVSENENVYRAEYLAYTLWQDPTFAPDLTDEADLVPLVSRAAATRYQEGYTKGVHDEDATRLLLALRKMDAELGLLRYPARVRACAQLFWQRFLTEDSREKLTVQLAGAGQILAVFPQTSEFAYLEATLQRALRNWIEATDVFPATVVEAAAAYLFHTQVSTATFVASAAGVRLYDAFIDHLKKQKAWTTFESALRQIEEQPQEQYIYARKWVQAYLETQTESLHLATLDEVAVWLVTEGPTEKDIIPHPSRQALTGMRGDHARIEAGEYVLDYHEFLNRLQTYTATVAPAFAEFATEKKNLLQSFRERIGLEEFQPRVLSSFVRNRLIDEVYLPLIGDNLAKQLGTVGEQSRTDRMGMLLLISPPGYGKTTLMEYIANRLGLIFMKINGPAIGHRVTSLAPADAPTLAARRELENLNLALEMGDNVMLYVDDIQHCHPEFLQKFISLCDAQRKIEGVYQGKARTYDLRGRRFAVVMAGNPYTESGEQFQIPDMLANRADIYNLGDVIGAANEAFELSYLENALTSNPLLRPLVAKHRDDVYALIEAIGKNELADLRLHGNHSAAETEQYIQVLRKMIRVRDLLLSVNRAYIQSAGMADIARTEPPCKLQGSYRNMNKLTEKIVPIMNEDELTTLLLAHYTGEAQTLTADAEANMLRLKDMLGIRTDAEQERWQEIVSRFREQRHHGNEQEQLAQLIAEFSDLTDGISGIRSVLAQAFGKSVDDA